MKTLLITLAFVLAGCVGEIPIPDPGAEPDPPVTPTTPYVVCVEIYNLVQSCDTAEPLPYQEGFRFWSFHAGNFNRGYDYNRTRVDVLNPLGRASGVYGEIVYDDGCGYDLAPEVMFPPTYLPMNPGETVTIYVDQVTCLGLDVGEHIVTVKIWDEFYIPLETVTIGYRIIL